MTLGFFVTANYCRCERTLGVDHTNYIKFESCHSKGRWRICPLMLKWKIFFLSFIFRLLVGVCWEELPDLFNVSVWVCGFEKLLRNSSERGRHVGQRHERNSRLKKDRFVAVLPHANGPERWHWCRAAAQETRKANKLTGLLRITYQTELRGKAVVKAISMKGESGQEVWSQIRPLG